MCKALSQGASPFFLLSKESSQEDIMARIPLIVQGVTDITASHEASLLILTDEEEKRQLTVVCGPTTRHEISVRRGKYVGSPEQRKNVIEALQYCMPEALSAMIKYLTDIQLCVVIVNIFDGQYRAILEDERTGTAFPIRVSDGALLSYADPHIPLYIEESLWRRQSVEYGGENAKGVAMPLNTLSTNMLRQAMQKCIDQEEYEMAQRLKEELDRREG